ncbi:universal stress protein [Sulfitobacter sp.]|uniref:universal stress protein n=1 Tax=Sulfitobacter sp. TaxID=1903071 RepID=UPI0030033997
MTIKTILACLTGDTGADSLMRAASALARRHDAHLIGLHTIESLMIYPGIVMHIPDTVYETYGVSQKEKSAALKALFERYTHAEDFVSEWRLLASGSETAADRIVESARCADIVLMAAAAPESDNYANVHLIETVIQDAGRPVIVIPSNFDADALGRSILIGWNGTREAARAAHDALTVLQDGDTAHILRVNDKSQIADHDATSNDLAAVFARHGIDTTLVHKTWEKPGVAGALNKEAFEKGADMIAVGAFGHSHAYDFVIGAATRDLLRGSDLPVMFSR